MALPIVAIVGRPNVGKSSLLNCLVRRMVSIVEPTAGVTRDRVSALCEVDGVYFELLDTGGYGLDDSDGLSKEVERQIVLGIAQASLLLFVVDVRDGIGPLDSRVAKLLRRHSDHVQLVVNKVDEPRMEPQAGEFLRLGYGDPICISARHNLGRRELLEQIAERVGHDADQRPVEPVIKLAVVGKRNTGKSTFINALAGEPRVIVSEVPGTTRDAVDVRIEKDGNAVLLIDTAGVRKRVKLADSIEFYGYTRATRSIRRADVVLLFIDATAPISVVDKRLADTIAREFRPCVIVINKWDLGAGRVPTGEFGNYLTKTLPLLSFAPVAFISALEGRNLEGLIDLSRSLQKQSLQRVGTSQLNNALAAGLALRTPSPKHGAKAPKIYYATQVAVGPPTIVLFVNHPGLITKQYERFLVNRFRELLPFEEIPIRLMFRASRGKDAP